MDELVIRFQQGIRRTAGSDFVTKHHGKNLQTGIASDVRNMQVEIPRERAIN
jgi:hypothetical protein